ncbi:MAG: hypothetical protein L0322_06255, partial [Chloroflexi bacterium]|nr:hypothetical protein [Chloroflexota bacterium]
MSDKEQNLADSLDAFLTAKMRGASEPAPADLPEAEARLAAMLLEVAQATEPDPEFRAALDAQLYRAARQATASRPEPMSFREKMTSLQGWRFLDMKRFVGIFAAAAAIVAVALFGYFIWSNLPGNQEGPIIAGPVETPTGETPPGTIETPVTGEPPALAALPPLQGPQAAGGFGGAGGGGGDGAPPVTEAGTDITIFEPVDVFSGTEFTLGTTLPTEPASALVQQEPVPPIVDAATAREIANRFGFTGPLYTNPPYEPPPGEPAPEIIPTYMAFNGREVVQMDSFLIYYSNPAITPDQAASLPFEQAAPIAENFLRERGLLTFAYEMRPGFSPGEVLFYRLIDGRPVNESEIYVGVTAGGVYFLSYNARPVTEDLGIYPLRSAEAAWQQLLAGVVAQQIPWTVMPNQANQPVEEPLPIKSWARSFTPGAEAHFYTWPGVLIAVEPGGVPRIETYPLAIQADDDTLRAIGQNPGHPYHFWGTVGPDGQTLQVAGYEVLDEATFQPLFLEGTIQRSGDQVLLNTATGETYLLPDAPADLPDGLAVDVFGPTTRDAGQEYPLLEWDSINEKYIGPEPTEGPVIIEPAPYEPYIYQQVTANSVELAYYLTYVQDEEALA